MFEIKPDWLPHNLRSYFVDTALVSAAQPDVPFAGRQADVGVDRGRGRPPYILAGRQSS